MTRYDFCFPALLVAILLVAAPTASHAGWSIDPRVNNPLCTAPGDQGGSQGLNGTQGPTSIVTDGAGGAIIAWVDNRSGNFDIYAQRISATGGIQWATNGVPICTIAPVTQDSYTIISIATDGAGGAIVAWIDGRHVSGDSNYDVYAQRISATGVVQWTADGVPVCTDPQVQLYLSTVSDGAGGAIVTWMDAGRGICAQRISASGAPQWTVDGVPVCSTNAIGPVFPTLVSDEAGGAIVTWMELRNGPPSDINYDIYAQRISATGTLLWTTDDVPLCTAALGQRYPVIVSDGAGGAIVAWADYRSGAIGGVYAQSISATGVVQWTTDGVPFGTTTSVSGFTQDLFSIVSDGAGGAIAAWFDKRGVNFDIYTQRMSATGVVLWTTDGVPVCTDPDAQDNPSIVSDGAGGAIVAWVDGRSSGTVDIYAQRVSVTGVPLWTTNGVPISTAIALQLNPTIVSDGAGGAIAAWDDYRSLNWDIYAQRVNAAGRLGQLTGVGDLPNSNLNARLSAWPTPFSAKLSLMGVVPEGGRVSLSVYDVNGRPVKVVWAGTSHDHGGIVTEWDGRNEAGRRVSAGIYFVRFTGPRSVVQKKVMLLR